MSHSKIGDVEVAQGDLPAALESYRTGMEIAERLAQSDPGNAGWQRDRIVSLVKLNQATGDKAYVAQALDISLHAASWRPGTE